MRSLILRPSKLLYPAGRNLSFDGSHPFAKGVRMSIVAARGGNNYINVPTGKPLVVSGSPTSGFNSRMGPYVIGGATNGNSFLNSSTTAPNCVTMAAIVTPITSNVFQPLICLNNTGSTGETELVLVSNVLSYVSSLGVTTSSGITALTANVPYFVACSVVANKTTMSFIVVNLLTGQVSTSTVTGAASNQNLGSVFVIGGASVNAGGAQWIAAAMVSTLPDTEFYSAESLLDWAKAPWDFWYPPLFERAFNAITPFNETIQLAASEAADVGSFSITQTSSGTLAASEVADAGSFTVAQVATAALAASEVADAGSFSASVIDSGTLTASEVADAGSFSGTVTVNDAALATTEAADVGSFSVTVANKGTLATTEAADVGSFSASVIDSVSLAASEVADAGSFSATVANDAALATTEVADVGGFAAVEIDNAVLAASEVADAVSAAGTVAWNVALTASEVADAASIAVTIGSITLAALMASEVGDFGNFPSVLRFAGVARFQWGNPYPAKGVRVPSFVRKNLLQLSGEFIVLPPVTNPPQPTSVVAQLEFIGPNGPTTTQIALTSSVVTYTDPKTDDTCTKTVWSGQWDSSACKGGMVFWTIYAAGGVQASAQGQFNILANPSNDF
jgi:hypothetical protein